MANYATSALKLSDTYVNTLPYNTCSTAAGTAAKTVSAGTFALETGAMVVVKFTTTNTAANPTLNVSSTGAKAIYYNGAAITKGYLKANKVYPFIYNGTQWDLVGDVDTDTNTNYYHTPTATAGIKIGTGNGVSDLYVPVDTSLSTTSTNLVQNKVVASAINDLQNSVVSHPINSGEGEYSLLQKTDVGHENTASGKGASAFGANNIAGANYAFAAGSWAAARNQAAFAANAGDASGEFAAAFGDSYAEVDRAFAKGFETRAKAYASETGGIESVVEVTGTAGVADGKGGVAAGPYSAVHNLECKTGENGKAAYAGGEYSEANHEGSFVHGIGLRSGANYQSVFGKYNAEDSEALFVVGGGSGDQNRATLFKINNSEARLRGNFYASNLYTDAGIYSNSGVSASGFYIKGVNNPNLYENTVYCADNSGNGKIYANKFIARQWNWVGGGWLDAELNYATIKKLIDLADSVTAVGNTTF